MHSVFPIVDDYLAVMKRAAEAGNTLAAAVHRKRASSLFDAMTADAKREAARLAPPPPKVYYVAVGDARCVLRGARRILPDRKTVEENLREAADRDRTGHTREHAKVYGYRTKPCAESGCLADVIGDDSGRVE